MNVNEFRKLVYHEGREIRSGGTNEGLDLIIDAYEELMEMKK